MTIMKYFSGIVKKLTLKKYSVNTIKELIRHFSTTLEYNSTVQILWEILEIRIL